MRDLLLVVVAVSALLISSGVSAQIPITRPHSKKPATEKQYSRSRPSKSRQSGKGKIDKTDAIVEFPIVQNCDNLDLWAIKDGKSYFISEREWQEMSEDERGGYQKMGLVIKRDGQCFSMALKKSREKLSLADAVSRYGHKVPTLVQAETIVSQYEDVKRLLGVYGGDRYVNDWYWTRTDSDTNPDHAWHFYLDHGSMSTDNKNYPYYVFTVMPITE